MLINSNIQNAEFWTMEQSPSRATSAAELVVPGAALPDERYSPSLDHDQKADPAMAQKMNPHTKLALHQRLEVARHMLHAFSPFNGEKIRKILDEDVDSPAGTPLSFHEFLQYAVTVDLIDQPWERAFQVADVARSLTNAGLLQKTAGLKMPPPFGDLYFAMHSGATKAQASGFLWLSESLGPEFLIRSFASSTIALVGEDENGDATTGSGILIDDRHILTNRHVVTDMRISTQLWTPTSPPAHSPESKVEPIEITVTNTTPHEAPDGSDNHLDVALIEVTGLENRYEAGKGIAFRDPQWSDTAWTFGYPPVPMTREPAVIVHRGEVVNPQVQGYFGNDLMLFSAVARPGNSGGPIVTQDGRIIGIVAEELSTKDTSHAPFYAGIPTHEIARALTDMGHPNLLNIETWKSPRD